MRLQDTERAALIGQLVAMDNVLHGVLESLQQAPEQETGCEHPPEQRKYAGEMGNARFTCGVCGATVAAVKTELDTSRLVRPNAE